MQSKCNFASDTNLLLSKKSVRACALQSIANPVQNAYAALSAAYADLGKLPESQIRVPEVGLEPTSLAAEDFKSSVYTIPPSGQIN